MSIGVAEVRYSMPGQATGYSEEGQIDAIEACAADLGCTHVEYFFDRAVSARRHVASAWKGMKDLVAYVKTHQIDYVFFAMEDRVTRQGDDFVLDVWPVIRQYAPSCKLINATYRIEVDPMSLEGLIRFAHGIDENETKAQRVAGSQKQALKQGRLPGQRPNYGFTYNTKTGELEPHEEKSLIVRFMFYLATWGHSFQQIATILNDAGIPSPSGKLWAKGSVFEIIKNPCYIGKRSWTFDPMLMIDQNEVNHYLEAISFAEIIPLHVWLRANELNSTYRPSLKLDTPFLFRNLLVCSHDNTTLSTINKTPGKSARQYRKYKCTTCGRTADIDAVHDLLVPKVQQEWFDRLFALGSDARTWMDKLKKEVDKRISKLRSELMDLKGYADVQECSPESIVYKSKNKELSQLTMTVERLDGLREDSGYYLAVEKWRELDMSGLTQLEFRRFLIEVVSRISIDLDNLDAVRCEYRMPVAGCTI